MRYRCSSSRLSFFILHGSSCRFSYLASISDAEYPNYIYDTIAAVEHRASSTTIVSSPHWPRPSPSGSRFVASGKATPSVSWRQDQFPRCPCLPGCEHGRGFERGSPRLITGTQPKPPASGTPRLTIFDQVAEMGHCRIEVHEGIADADRPAIKQVRAAYPGSSSSCDAVITVFIFP